MQEEHTSTPATTPIPSGAVMQQGRLSPEVVAAVAERVYTLLLADLRRERERQGRRQAADPRHWRV